MNTNKRIELQGGWQRWTGPEKNLYPVFQRISVTEAEKFKKLIIRHGAKNNSDNDRKNLKLSGYDQNSREFSNIVNYLKNTYYIKYKNAHIHFNFNDENLKIEISLDKEFFNNMSPFNKTLNYMRTSNSTNEVIILLNQRVAFTYIKLGGGLDLYVMGGVVNYLLCPENDFMFNNIIDIDSSLFPKYLNEYSNVMYWILNDFLITVGLKQGIVSLFNDLNINNEILKKEQEEKKRRDEEQRKREEYIKKEKEEKERITKEKNSIKHELEIYLNNVDKNNYYEKEYEFILKSINDFILQLPRMQDYKYEYKELISTLKKVKTIKKCEKFKKIEKYTILSSVCLTSVVIFAILLTNLIIPILKYNNAIECIYNQEYNNAETIFKDLDGFKDSDLQLELIDVYKLLNNNQYVEAIELFEKNNGKVNIEYNPNGGEIQEKLRSLTNSRFKVCNKKGYNFIRYVIENYEINTKKELVLDIKLKAIYEIIQYNISYDLNDGVLENSNPVTYNVLSNDFTLSSPSKEGYSFVGWFYNGEEVVSIKKGTMGNLLLTAKYEPIYYDIVYNLNGGINNENNLLEYNIESNSIIINSPQKPGYSFIGWTIKGDEKIYNEFQIDTGSIGDIELTANWKANNYKITYELNGGINNSTNPDGYIMNNGEIIIKDAIKDGYSFMGWISDENSSPIKNYVINEGEYGNIKLTAIFTPNKYVISFDLNGSDNSFISSLSVTFDSEYKLTKPSRTAYEFVAWEYNNSNFDLKGIYNISNNITLIAKWKPINYKITYNLNNGENAANNPESYNTEESIELLSPSRVGYNFIGWSTVENQVPNLNYIIPLNSYGDLSITANFEPKKFKITYDVNNGNQLSNNEQIVEYDSLFDTVIPTRVGYTFDCWNLKDNKFEISKWNLLEDIELVASWKANVYDVEIIDEVSNTFKVTYDSNFRIDNQLKDNYIFKGYFSEPYGKGIKYTDEKGNSLCIFKNVENLKLYPYYQYQINFISNGGSELQSVIYDENIMLSSSVITEKNNRTFEGWYKDINLTEKFNEVIGNITIYAKWKEETETNYFNYSYGSSVILTNYFGAHEIITIPSHIGGNPVTTIGNSAFMNKSIITDINLNEELTNINSKAFYGCTSLKNIKLPKSLLFIGEEAFLGCTSIFEFEIPTSVENVGLGALKDCTSLNTIGYSLDSIPSSVFGWLFGIKNNELNSYYVPDSLENINILGGEKIPDKYFYGCTTDNTSSQFINIKLGDSIIELGDYSFGGCTKLGTIDLPASVCIIGEYAFTSCTNLVKIDLPNLIEKIEPGTFSNCSRLTDVILPENLKEIGSRAFSNCQKLNEIDIPNTIEKIESYAFYGTVLREITLPSAGEQKYSSQNFMLESIFGTIPSSLEKVIITGGDCIGKGAFKNCSVGEIILPNTIVTIEAEAFRFCGINSIKIPDSVLTIGDNAFIGCNGLGEILIPISVTTIGTSCFLITEKNFTFYCEAIEKPAGWNVSWALTNYYGEFNIIWGYNKSLNSINN